MACQRPHELDDPLYFLITEIKKEIWNEKNNLHNNVRHPLHLRGCAKIAGTVSTAWRVDFSDVFEKFVQHIFKLTSKETGGRLVSNFAFHSKASKRFPWALKHVEPDAIYQKENLLVFIDAKYNRTFTADLVLAKN